ncbi:alpha/beta fold hydrolase [Pseudonocardia sp. MH-G8]|uniref:alpha/beta fold hydrolase n=1 Tax=Pseudonocardia sp. MH-G8 TaxID=1854588 RepID=UPI000BA0B8EB|nr:alpha/beta hydrolase [Pseudonocardia sp. MH-G8]OZM76546.1 alpha/beta hydrolase [Pseudonocardia sp. MH-G8]
MATRTDALGPTHEVQLPEGRIRYHERGEGPPIVFVHGIVANADVWRHVVPGLADRYRCITPDWPLGGHELPMREGTDFSLFGLADLVHRTLAALDLDAVTLVGNDTGGAVCQAVAARHPARLARLVLTPCDAFDNFLPLPIKHLQLLGQTSAGLKVLAESLRFRPIQRLPIAFGLLTRRSIPADIMASYTGPLRDHPGTRRDFARLVRAISTRYTEDAAAALPGFDRPTLLAWSRQNFFPLAHARRLAGLLPHARLEVLDDAGPFVAEDQPGQLTRLIDEFLAAANRP